MEVKDPFLLEEHRVAMVDEAKTGVELTSYLAHVLSSEGDIWEEEATNQQAPIFLFRMLIHTSTHCTEAFYKQQEITMVMMKLLVA